MFLIDELPDEGEVILRNFGPRGSGEFGGWVDAQTARAVAAGCHFLAEVTEERLVETGGAEGAVDDFLKALKVGLFATLEEIDHALSESVEVVRLFKESITLPDSRRFDGDVTEVFEMANRFDDFFFGLSDGSGGCLGVDFKPFVAGFGGFKEFAKEGLASGVEAVEEMVQVAGEGDFVGGVEGGGRFEKALQFEVGQEGIDDERTNVVGAGEFISGDVELTGLVQEDAEDGAEGIGLRGIAVGEVGEGAEIVAAGQEFAVGLFAIAPGSTDFLGVVFERFREVVVIDGSNVRLIDAHAKGDGGANDRDLAGHEGVLDFGTGLGTESGVVGACGEVVAFEKGGEGFGPVLQGGVDDGGLNGGGLEAVEKVLLALVTGDWSDNEIEIGPVKGELMVIFFFDLEVATDITGYLGRGGGGEAEDAGYF